MTCAGKTRLTHQSNVGRYRRLLQTYLTETETRFIEQRLAEEIDVLARERGSLLTMPRDGKEMAAPVQPQGMLWVDSMV